MNRVGTAAALSLAAVICSPAVGVAQDKVDFGKREYDANCAVCHGTKGKGDGPFARTGQTRAFDLTVLSKNNDGVFPLSRVYDIIDGTQEVKAHGTREMPIWGQEYRREAAEHYMDFPALCHDPEAYVRVRILALAEYIHRLQRK
jgi:mono/diheme cytochrome c family protein